MCIGSFLSTDAHALPETWIGLIFSKDDLPLLYPRTLWCPCGSFECDTNTCLVCRSPSWISILRLLDCAQVSAVPAPSTSFLQTNSVKCERHLVVSHLLLVVLLLLFSLSEIELQVFCVFLTLLYKFCWKYFLPVSNPIIFNP